MSAEALGIEAHGVGVGESSGGILSETSVNEQWSQPSRRLQNCA